jgi:pimeloyl-ACP methyl ester carboxylesterase
VVFAPTLTGLGDRSHLLSASVDLQTHVQDVLNVLKYEDLGQVVLVGHSYAGLVISVVADRAPERIAHLVYLDAFVPRDGESLLELLPAPTRAAFVDKANTRGEGWRVPPQRIEQYGVREASDVAWASARLGDQPLLTFEQPVRLRREPRCGRTYIACTQFVVRETFRPFAERAQQEPGWTYHVLDTGHDAMITAPDALAAVLLQV